MSPASTVRLTSSRAVRVRPRAVVKVFETCSKRTAVLMLLQGVDAGACVSFRATASLDDRGRAGRRASADGSAVGGRGLLEVGELRSQGVDGDLHEHRRALVLLFERLGCPRVGVRLFENLPRRVVRIVGAAG